MALSAFDDKSIPPEMSASARPSQPIGRPAGPGTTSQKTCATPGSSSIDAVTSG